MDTTDRREATLAMLRCYADNLARLRAHGSATAMLAYTTLLAICDNDGVATLTRADLHITLSLTEDDWVDVQLELFAHGCIEVQRGVWASDAGYHIDLTAASMPRAREQGGAA